MRQPRKYHSIPISTVYVIAEVKIENMTTNRDRAGGNYEQADEQLAKQWNCTPEQVADWHDRNKYTWHELNDTKTMQLVPTALNGTCGHFGGSAETKY